jgi:hypothetical protein
MTPEERKLVIDLFDRLATVEDADRDSEAERLIRDGLRQAPNAPYALVQTVLVQDEALKRANARIQELETSGEAHSRDTSFLGAVRDSILGTRETRGSVPTVKRGSGSAAEPMGMSPAWRTGTQSVPPTPMPTAAPMGGSFLGTAASTAAGVIGGALLLDGIRSMMGTHPAAHGAFAPGTAAAFDPSASSSWVGGAGTGDLSRQAGLEDVGRPNEAHDVQDSGFGLMDQNDGDDEDYNGDDGGFDVGDDSTDV